MQSAERGQFVPMVLLELFMGMPLVPVQIGQRDVAFILRMAQPSDLRMIRPMDLMLIFGEVAGDEDVIII